MAGVNLQAADIVRIQAGGQFQLHGEVWLPRGVNSYPLLQHAAAGRLDAVRDIYAQAVALRRPLVRTPAFLDEAAGPVRTRDARGRVCEVGLCALDRVMALAAESGVRILPILANNWPDFGGAPAVLRMVAPDEKLPKDAFWRDERAQRAQLDYQVALASRINSLNGRRYADDPTLFAWELVNEARIERRFGRYRGNARTLAHWAKRMATGLRDAGVQQPIAWGGAGYLGEHGEDLRIIAAEGGVDILTSHLYGTRVRATRGRSRAAVAIAWGEAHLRAQYEVARAAGLPLLLEEVNWKPEAHNDAAERAHVLRAWLEMAHGLGVGTLPWMIGERGREDYDGYLIRPEDNASCEVLQRA